MRNVEFRFQGDDQRQSASVSNGVLNVCDFDADMHLIRSINNGLDTDVADILDAVKTSMDGSGRWNAFSLVVKRLAATGEPIMGSSPK